MSNPTLAELTAVLMRRGLHADVALPCAEEIQREIERTVKGHGNEKNYAPRAIIWPLERLKQWYRAARKQAN